jgi:tetratricopeptide (TPR) repeat protein
VRAKVRARRGEHESAERLARKSVALAEGTDFLNDQADAYADLAEVLELAGGRDEASAALEHALTLYERKRNLAMAERGGRGWQSFARRPPRQTEPKLQAHAGLLGTKSEQLGRPRKGQGLRPVPRSNASF